MLSKKNVNRFRKTQRAHTPNQVTLCSHVSKYIYLGCSSQGITALDVFDAPKHDSKRFAGTLDGSFLLDFLICHHCKMS